jgi:hypothetical protein
MIDQLLQTLGTEIGKFLDSPIVRLALQGIAFYVVLLWAATAYWAYRDLQTRTTNPIAPYLAAALIILFTPAFFFFGVIVYRILRPSETVAEANERALAEEAMMVEIESQPHCANCSRQVHATGCAVCARTAAGWSSSTGRCAPGVARTSSGRSCSRRWLCRHPPAGRRVRSSCPPSTSPWRRRCRRSRRARSIAG